MALLVDIDNLKKFNSIIDEGLNDDYLGLQKSILDLKNSLFDMGNAWQGSDHDNFNTKMEDFAKDLNDVYDYISELQSYLNDYIAEIKRIDDKFSSSSVNFNQK